MVVSTALVLATYVHPNLCRELGCCHHHPHNRCETCLLVVCCELQINGENAHCAAKDWDIRDQYADDKNKQQQAMMELWKKKINPMGGCLLCSFRCPCSSLYIGRISRVGGLARPYPLDR